MTTLAEALATLTGPGGPFEIIRDDVLGNSLLVYKDRLRSMRELAVMADARGDATWVVQGEERLSYAEHNARVRALAHSLLELGLRPGDRVALLSANNPAWIEVFWACAVAGLICVPLNAWWKADELAFALDDCEARVLVCDERRSEVVSGILADRRALSHTFVIGTPAFAELCAGPDPGTYPDVPIDEDDISGIFYTSGTTGRPKGATITHRQVLANLQNILCLGVAQAMVGGAPAADAGANNAALLVVPLFHTTGCHATMVLNYAAGWKLVLMPPGRFDAEVAMRLIEQERVTAIGGVPTIMWRIVEHPRRHAFDLSSVTRISYGGAPAAPELVARITEAFPNARTGLATAYGLTESASVATAISGEDYIAHPGSAGRPVPTVELRIVDTAGNDLPPGEAGEIWLRGPTVSGHGYWRRPDANAASYSPGGWFHTGDIGKVDADGYLYIVDRAKDIIIRGGENISTVEVENVLFEHPDVIDAAVVGVPHKELGEEVKAVVQRRPGADLTPEQLQAFCRERLADFKVPAYVEILDDPLPRNPAGKVLKAALRGGETAFAPADDSAL